MVKKIEDRQNRIWWTQSDVELELGIAKDSIKKLIDEGNLNIYQIPGTRMKRYKREEVLELPKKISNAVVMAREANNRTYKTREQLELEELAAVDEFKGTKIHKLFLKMEIKEKYKNM